MIKSTDASPTYLRIYAHESPAMIRPKFVLKATDDLAVFLPFAFSEALFSSHRPDVVARCKSSWYSSMEQNPRLVASFLIELIWRGVRLSRWFWSLFSAFRSFDNCFTVVVFMLYGSSSDFCLMWQRESLTVPVCRDKSGQLKNDA